MDGRITRTGKGISGTQDRHQGVNETDMGTLAFANVLEIDPAAIADLNGLPPEQDNGLLLAAAITNGLSVSLERPANFYPGDVLGLTLDGVDIGVTETIQAGSEGDPYTLLAPASDLVEGMHALNYVVRLGTTGRPTYGATPVTITIDRTPPGDVTALFFSPDIAKAGGVVESDLSSGFLDATLPAYEHSEPGDAITVYVDGDPLPVIYVADGHDSDADHTVSIPRSAFEKTDGEHRITYKVVDRAGNEGQESSPTTLNSLLIGVITDLEAPEVDAYTNDVTNKLIDDADARNTVDVRVPGNAKVLDGDEIIVHWGSIDLAPVSVDKASAGKPVEVSVAYADVYAEWTKQSNDADKVSTSDVTYEVRRYGLLAGEAPSLSVDSNLYLPGGVDPDPESPVHGLLLKPSVRSVSNTPNEITIDDSEKTGNKILVPFQNTKGVPALVKGDVITLFFAGTTIALAALTATPTADVEHSLTVAQIAAAKIGDQVYSYTITRSVAGGGINTSQSPDANLKITTKAVLPGKGTLPTLVAANLNPMHEFNGNSYIDYDDLYPGTKSVIVTVPVYENVLSTDVIKVTMQLYKFGEGADMDDGAAVGTLKTYTADSTSRKATLPKADLEILGEDSTARARVTYSVTAKDYQNNTVTAKGEFRFTIELRH